MAAQFSTLGTLIGLAIAITLIIRKIAPACLYDCSPDASVLKSRKNNGG